MLAKRMPKWQNEMNNFKGIKSTFIIEGNIIDDYPWYPQDDNPEAPPEFCPLNRVIANIFNSGTTEGFYNIQFCDPLFGFSDPLNFNNAAEMVRLFDEKVEETLKEVQAINSKGRAENHSGAKMVRNSEIIRTSMTQRAASGGETQPQKSIVNVINFASRFLSAPDSMSADETTFFLNLLYASNNAIRGNKYKNTLVLVVNKVNDIPAWFFLDNPNVRMISIPNPDRAVRIAYIDKYFNMFKENVTPETEKAHRKFIDLTEGMKTAELGELRRLKDTLDIPTDEIADVVAIYKYGIKDKLWEQIRNTLFSINIEERIERRVKGQSEATKKIVQVVKRAVVGLSGLQHSSGTKPRGILFLAGPTGTGKTEIVKTLTELLFGDERALLRFDMSEYTAEHADQKLFGAPPGYVGYDNGGQLTNAVKSNPFSILLFDEIEKAHPNIMDKFLQILEDGRMTDGQGNTVYFTETLIFFTSNVGISKEEHDPITGKVIGRTCIVSPGEPYEDIKSKVEDAMSVYFKPEIINRIGRNIVVFNYTSESVSKQIVDMQITRINDNLRKESKINVVFEGSASEYLYGLCLDDEPRKHGGRGIGNVIEERYLNLLAEFVYDNDCREGDTITVKSENNELFFGKE